MAPLLPATTAAAGTRAAPRAIAAGDNIVVYLGHTSMRSITVDPSATFNCSLGHFPMRTWLGQPFGCRVYSNTGKWVILLAPTPELWTRVLRHRTQILYVADIAQICAGLELRPGAVVRRLLAACLHGRVQRGLLCDGTCCEGLGSKRECRHMLSQRGVFLCVLQNIIRSLFLSMPARCKRCSVAFGDAHAAHALLICAGA